MARLIKWEETAVVAFAWSGLFVGCLCSLKRSRSVRLVLPINIVLFCFFSSFKLDHIC